MNLIEQITQEEMLLEEKLNKINEQSWSFKENQLKIEATLIDDVNRKLSHATIQRLLKNPQNEPEIKNIIIPFTGEEFIKGKVYNQLQKATLDIDTIISNTNKKDRQAIKKAQKVLKKNGWSYLNNYIDNPAFLELLNKL
ncbi:MAG: hypothetical protein ATN36_07070 [Epulopiscium sp. Nele67-Bin005]|nr:MAG: hypothetical protein ATN36_07070 [Epulopiscium sp. Nele67-Bin005]